MLRVARVAAWVLLVNGLLGLGAWLWVGLSSGFDRELPYLALLGVLAGGLSLYQYLVGAWGGIVFYGFQLVSYHAFGGGASFSYKSGLSLAYVAHLRDGVLVVNLAALVLMLAGVAIVAYAGRTRTDDRRAG